MTEDVEERVEISEHDQALIRRAYADGYADGERNGYRIGGEEALKAAQTLTMLMNDERLKRALERLIYFLGTDRDLDAEVEEPSRYWRSNGHRAS